MGSKMDNKILYRVINRETGLFLRDDFNYDPNAEMGLVTDGAQGLYKPIWDFESNGWIEGLSQDEIDKAKNAPQEPSEIDLLKEQIKYQAEKLKAQEDAIAAVLDLQIL